MYEPMVWYEENLNFQNNKNYYNNEDNYCKTAVPQGMKTANTNYGLKGKKQKSKR